MSLQELNSKIEQSDIYQFCLRHKKVINIVQGLFIIGLLIAINIYVVKDYFIKQQIADHCGYTTSNYECICDKDFVNMKKLEMSLGESGKKLGELNLTINNSGT